MMKLYIDSDSLPLRHRSIILRRIIKRGYEAWFAADRSLPDVLLAIDEDKAKRREPYRGILDKEEIRKIGSGIHMIVVEKGENSADDELVSIATPPALAISHDIPLLSRLIEKGITVMDDRGNEYDESNIGKRLSERGVNSYFREMGVFSEKQKSFDERTIRAFSETFDKLCSELESIDNSPITEVKKEN